MRITSEVMPISSEVITILSEVIAFLPQSSEVKGISSETFLLIKKKMKEK